MLKSEAEGQHACEGDVVRRPLEGIRVLEASCTPLGLSTGALLADWGADVVSLELRRGSLVLRPKEPRFAGPIAQHLNRGKRSVEIDLIDGHGFLHALVAKADVFLTDVVGAVRRAWQIDVDSLRLKNSSLIYARATAVGPGGAEGECAGGDYTSYWTRGGLATTFQLADRSLVAPALAPAEGFGSYPTAAVLAGGVAAAVYRRSVTGESATVDASLLGFAIYHLSMDVASVASGEGAPASGSPPVLDRSAVRNALTNSYRTKDGRFITLCVLQERFYSRVCERLGCPDLVTDERFATGQARTANAGALVREFNAIFERKTLAEWQNTLRGAEWVWEVCQTITELIDDPQVAANQYLITVGGGTRVVAGPVQFDESPSQPNPAPTSGQHTKDARAEIGF